VVYIRWFQVKYKYETCIEILHVTSGKVEGKMSLSETDSWFRKGGETACEMDNETIVETSNETDEKRNKKDTLGSVISSESQIVTNSRDRSGFPPLC
jgi:hypothetical protein